MKSVPKAPYFKAWIVFYPVVFIGTAFVSILANAGLGVAYEVTARKAGELPTFLPALVTVLLGMPISYFTFRWVIRWVILPRLETSPDSPSSVETEANRPSLPPVGPKRHLHGSNPLRLP